MAQKITKEMIITELQKQYNETGDTLSKYFKYSTRTVCNRFGSWNDALISAGIPLKRNKPQEVKCLQCSILFMKPLCKIKNYPNHFCSHSCSATYCNTRRAPMSNILKSRHNLTHDTNKVKCIMCENIVRDRNRKTCSNECFITYKRLPEDDKNIISMRIRHDDNYRVKKCIVRLCIICGGEFNGNRKTCSQICYRQRLGEIGKRGGRASQLAQQRRSKGEILFYELCVKYFGKDDVLSNEQIFVDNNGNFWDCDICITSAKLAVCYNGIYHYKQVARNHSVAQVQARDNIKKKVIFDNGYIQYIVKDMGKFSADFVYKEFHHFIFRTFIHLELKMLADF